MNQKEKEKLIKELERLKTIKGEERGADIKFLAKYLKQKEGKENYDKLVEFLRQELDFRLPDLEKLNSVDWIPASIPHIFMVGMVRYFNWTEEEILELGRKVLGFSRSIRIFTKHFVSAKFSIKKVTENWNKYYSFGKAELISFKKAKKEAVMRIYDFNTHPVVCKFLEGVIEEFLKVFTGSKQTRVEETKCMCRGADYHEFKLNW